MKYALIKNGKVVNSIVSGAEFVQSIQSEYDHIEAIDTELEQSLGVGVGWGWDGSFIAPEIEEQPEPAPPKRHITNLAFRQRFTRAEKTALELAALDNPAATTEQRAQSAALRADLKDQEQASYIDLDRADTRAGVMMLEAAGLIASGRALEILDAPVQDVERPR